VHTRLGLLRGANPRLVARLVTIMDYHELKNKSNEAEERLMADMRALAAAHFCFYEFFHVWKARDDGATLYREQYRPASRPAPSPCAG